MRARHLRWRQRVYGWGGRGPVGRGPPSTGHPEEIGHNCAAPLFGIVLGCDSNVLGSLVEISKDLSVEGEEPSWAGTSLNLTS